MSSIRPGLEWYRMPFLSWLTLACSILLTVLAWDRSARAVHARLREQFVLHAEQTAIAISHRVLEYEAVLRSGVALFVASQLVTRTDFRRFCEHLEIARYYPGFQGIAFARHLARVELEGFVSQVRGEGFTNFKVHPEGERETYVPVAYIEPFSSRNLRAFGYDMFSESRRRAALQRAAETGRASATPVLQLIQDKDEANTRTGFLIYLPVFSGPADAPEVRRRNVYGYVYSAVLVRDLMRGILDERTTDRDIALYDEEANHPFFDTRRSGSQREAELEHRQTLKVAGQTWTLRSYSRPGFARWISRDEPLRLLGGGIVINLLLFYILVTSASLQRRAQVIAAGMTEQLQDSHRREQAQMVSALREKETLLREIHHRVKNNLQVISSLLSLQRHQATEPRTAEPLLQSQHRVLTLAALHDYLLRAEDLSRVDVRAYLSHVVGVLSTAYEASRKVTVEVDIAEVPLDVDQAISCGLIVNELVSNAFKYAYLGREGGKLWVRLQAADASDVVLEVEDDGPSLPGDVSVEVPATLGLQVVELLTHQLGGRIALSRDQGAHFRVVFPLSKGAHG